MARILLVVTAVLRVTHSILAFGAVSFGTGSRGVKYITTMFKGEESFGWHSMLPVLHNLRLEHIDSAKKILYSSNQASFSLRNTEAIKTIPHVLSGLNMKEYSIGASSIQSEDEVLMLWMSTVRFI